MEWTPAQEVDVTYFTVTSPLVPVILTGSTNRQLTISYNTEYNLSVVAVTSCRPNATAFIILNYGEVAIYTSNSQLIVYAIFV